MRKTCLLLISLFAIFIGINKVYAFDEYYAIVETNGSFTIRNAISNSNVAAGAARDAIATYNSSTSTLTLKEGQHFDYVQLKKAVTVTSSGKEVFVNLLDGYNNVVLNNFKSTSYDTSSTRTLIEVGGNRLYTGMEITGSLKMIDSSLIFHKHASSEGTISVYDLVEITNSYLDIEQMRGAGEHVKLTDSTFILAGITSYDDGDGSTPMEITNCHIQINKEASFVSNEYLVAQDKLTIKNSEIINNGTIGGTDVLIENSTVTYDETKLPIANTATITNLTLKNSTLKSYARFLVNNVSLTDSYLEINTKLNQHIIDRRGWDYSHISALIVLNNFESENSNFKIVQSGTTPAFLIAGEFITDIDSLGFVDSDGNILDLKKVNIEEYGFVKNPEGTSVTNNNSTIISGAFTEAYTLVLNDVPTYSLEPKSIDTYTFKIINGTWEDGTTEPLIKRIVRGTTIDSSLIKTKANESNMELVITKTGDNEYTYEYIAKAEEKIVNPKTGVKDFVLLLIISLLVALVISYNKNKFSLFKNV